MSNKTPLIEIYSNIPKNVGDNYRLMIHVDSEYRCLERIAKKGISTFTLDDSLVIPQFSPNLREISIWMPRVANRMLFKDFLWKLAGSLAVPNKEVVLVTDCWSDYERCDCFSVDETQGDEIALAGPFDRIIFDANMIACSHEGDTCPIFNLQASRVFAG